MPDNLVPSERQTYDYAIVNLDKSSNTRTHWICYWKSGNRVFVFDYFGGIPRELVNKIPGDLSLAAANY